MKCYALKDVKQLGGGNLQDCHFLYTCNFEQKQFLRGSTLEYILV